MLKLINMNYLAYLWEGLETSGVINGVRTNR